MNTNLGYAIPCFVYSGTWWKTVDVSRVGDIRKKTSIDLLSDEIERNSVEYWGYLQCKYCGACVVILTHKKTRSSEHRGNLDRDSCS